MNEFDDFWDDLIDMLEQLRSLVADDRKRYTEDIDLIFDKDKRLIYVTLPFPLDVKINSISINDGNLVIQASNGRSYYKAIDLTVPLKRVVSYSLKNGVLDITIEY